MRWYAYIGYFFAGAFLANSVPHFVQGITGQEFQTPFGESSSAIVNVIWGFVNFAIGYSIITGLGKLSFPLHKAGRDGSPGGHSNGSHPGLFFQLYLGTKRLRADLTKLGLPTSTRVFLLDY